MSAPLPNLLLALAAALCWQESLSLSQPNPRDLPAHLKVDCREHPDQGQAGVIVPTGGFCEGCLTGQGILEDQSEAEESSSATRTMSTSPLTSSAPAWGNASGDAVRP